jgi:tetratricopeptide (TPR) repeat protein
MVESLRVGAITFFGIATVLVGQPKVVQAISPLSSAAELSADAAYNLGFNKYFLHDYLGAIEALTQAIRLNPQEVSAYVLRSSAYTYLEDYTEAIADATQALKIAPNNAIAYNNRCYARARGLRDYQKAIEDCNQSIRLDPNQASSYASRCYVRASLGEQEALEDCEQALKLDPSYVYGYEDLGLARTALGDKQEALKNLQTAAALFEQQGDTTSFRRVQGLIKKLQE